MRQLIPDLEIHFDAPAGEDDLIERLTGRRYAMVYMAYLSARVLGACTALKAVTYLSTGLATHADLAAAEQYGIVIKGVKGYGDRAVAEHALMLMLAALRQIALMDRTTRQGRWGLVRGEEIGGKTVGIIGLGGIGKATARMAAALGARVIAWNRSGLAPDCPAEFCPLEELLRQSDIVSLHLALNAGTERFLDQAKIARMRPGAVLVNTARAGLVDEAALLQALRSGHVGHAALDVFHQEPPEKNNPLLLMDTVTLSAHSAWFTGQAIGRLLQAGFATLKAQIENYSPSN